MSSLFNRPFENIIIMIRNVQNMYLFRITNFDLYLYRQSSFSAYFFYHSSDGIFKVPVFQTNNRIKFVQHVQVEQTVFKVHNFWKDTEVPC